MGTDQTCRGSHTHSVVSGAGDAGKIIVYNSGTASVREDEELEGSYDESPGDDRTALFRIDVIEIPIDWPVRGSHRRLADGLRRSRDGHPGRTVERRGRRGRHPRD